MSNATSAGPADCAQVINLSKVLKTREKAALPPRSDALSFVSRRKRHDGGGFNYWDVKPTGSYQTDCDAGKALALEYLSFIAAFPTYGNGTLLTCIVSDMIDQAKNGAPWSGLHGGFLASVNGYAMSTAAFLHTNGGRTA